MCQFCDCRGRVTCKYSAICSRPASSERSHVEATSQSCTAKARRVACPQQIRHGLLCTPLLASRSGAACLGYQCTLRNNYKTVPGAVNHECVFNAACSLQVALVSCTTGELTAAQKRRFR